ncbi:MAG: putative Ig domain-containing protein, partial [Candidatus Nanohalobium sp.]
MIEVNGEHSYTVQVDDEDGLGSLSFRKLEGPSGLSINGNGVVEWTPGPDASGRYPVKLQVEDSGGLTDSQNYTLEVQQNDNTPPNPQISVNTSKGPAPLTVKFDASGSSDPDGSIANYTWESGEGRNSSGKTAVFTYRKPGVYVATLEVTDNEGATSSASVKVNVTGNSAPYFTSDPAVTGEVGKAYSYDAEATDPDGNALSYSLNQSPSGMSIDSDSGKVSWTPSSSGTYDVEIVVSDGEASVSQSYSIDVQSDNSGGGSDNPEDGGGSDDSDGGSSGGSSGGDSYSGGGWYFVSQSQSIEERLSFVNPSFNLELSQGATGKRNISLNFTEQTRVNLGTEGNISEVLKLPNSFNGSEGMNNVTVTVNATQPGTTQETSRLAGRARRWRCRSASPSGLSTSLKVRWMWLSWVIRHG